MSETEYEHKQTFAELSIWELYDLLFKHYKATGTTSNLNSRTLITDELRKRTGN